ncbi:MAG: hypothetical protein Kow00127_17470 [Bacteroidales bacterium]
MVDDKSKLKQGIQNLANKVGDAIQDLASLEVTTYAGEFRFDLSEIKDDDSDIFRIKNLMQTARAQLNASIRLVAYSRFEIDADASNIVSESMSEEDRILLEAHKEMVKAAQEARRAMFDFAKNLIK